VRVSSLSSPFIHRPVATTLLTVGIALAGAVGYRFLPVSPLPQVEFPTISVQAGLPGASPETMASSVATPRRARGVDRPGTGAPRSARMKRRARVPWTRPGRRAPALPLPGEGA